MNGIEHIIQKYTEDVRLDGMRQQFRKERSICSLQGMVGAQKSFVIAGLAESLKKTMLLVANTKEEAAYLLNNLESIIPHYPIWFLPDSCKKPGQYIELKSHQILQKTETVNKITSRDAKTHLVVSYPEALIEKVVAPQVLDKKRIQISINEEIDLDFLIEILVEYHFESVDFVYEPGQFSIRGGIVDIFSFGNEWPYRIELFDEEVESIRMFNPITQLSIRNISHLSILPNINTGYEDKEKVSILSVLPKDAIIWVQDDSFLLDRMLFCFDQMNQVKATQVDIPESMPEIVIPAQWMSRLTDYSLCLEKKGGHLQTDFDIALDGLAQPAFNKNFQLLIEDLEHKQKQGFEAYLFSDNSRQIRRFEAIFEDLKAQVKLQSILISIDRGFIDPHHNIACYTDHEIFQRFHKYSLRRGFTRDQALTLKFLKELQPGDYVTHIDHGVGKYSGLETIDISGKKQESVRLIYRNNDILYVAIQSLHKIARFVGKDGQPPKLDKLGSDHWKKLKSRTKKKVKDIAGQLILLYAKRKAAKGYAFAPDGYLQNELEASFFFEDTPDQFKTTQDVKTDMEQEHPMDRLICGDVGFGKTEIAVRATFKSVVNGKQVAVLVPTTILALQHYKTFSDRLKDFGVTIDYLNRFRSTRERSEIYKRLEEGKIEVIIGTHALLNKKIKFKDLGLLVVDEEQKFGVSAKEKLRRLKVNVDTLTLTATPIPRTLQFSLMGARDLSIIRTPPPNRQAIHTEIRVFSDDLIKEAIYHEINRDGQVFFVHNRVKNLEEMAAMLRKMCPDIDIAVAHGQMEAKELEKSLVAFIDGKYDLLLCTNIIETGLDIPNANTIIINNAHHFGMSDLHQLRGRVGRSNRKAYCFLFCPPMSTITNEARKRLRTLEEFSELGSGFNIAMKDLDIRGAGNLLGAEQSGFISEIGYGTYQKILEEAMQELKQNEFKELFENESGQIEYVRDVHIDTDIEMLIPDHYVSNIQERLALYTELDAIEDHEGLQKFQNKISDRFGPIPEEVYPLFDVLDIRRICKQLGFERFVFKNGTLKCFFVRNAQSSYFESDLFKEIMGVVANAPKSAGHRLKQTDRNLILINDKVKTLEDCKQILDEIYEATHATSVS